MQVLTDNEIQIEQNITNLQQQQTSLGQQLQSKVWKERLSALQLIEQDPQGQNIQAFTSVIQHLLKDSNIQCLLKSMMILQKVKENVPQMYIETILDLLINVTLHNQKTQINSISQELILYFYPQNSQTILQDINNSLINLRTPKIQKTILTLLQVIILQNTQQGMTPQQIEAYTNTIIPAIQNTDLYIRQLAASIIDMIIQTSAPGTEQLIMRVLQQKCQKEAYVYVQHQLNQDNKQQQPKSQQKSQRPKQSEVQKSIAQEFNVSYPEPIQLKKLNWKDKKEALLKLIQEFQSQKQQPTADFSIQIRQLLDLETNVACSNTIIQLMEIIVTTVKQFKYAKAYFSSVYLKLKDKKLQAQAFESLINMLNTLKLSQILEQDVLQSLNLNSEICAEGVQFISIISDKAKQNENLIIKDQNQFGLLLQQLIKQLQNSNVQVRQGATQALADIISLYIISDQHASYIYHYILEDYLDKQVQVQNSGELFQLIQTINLDSMKKVNNFKRIQTILMKIQPKLQQYNSIKQYYSNIQVTDEVLKVLIIDNISDGTLEQEILNAIPNENAAISPQMKIFDIQNEKQLANNDQVQQYISQNLNNENVLNLENIVQHIINMTNINIGSIQQILDGVIQQILDVFGQDSQDRFVFGLQLIENVLEGYYQSMNLHTVVLIYDICIFRLEEQKCYQEILIFSQFISQLFGLQIIIYIMDRYSLEEPLMDHLLKIFQVLATQQNLENLSQQYLYSQNQQDISLINVLLKIYQYKSQDQLYLNIINQIYQNISDKQTFMQYIQNTQLSQLIVQPQQQSVVQKSQLDVEELVVSQLQQPKTPVLKRDNNDVYSSQVIKQSQQKTGLSNHLEELEQLENQFKKSVPAKQYSINTPKITQQSFDYTNIYDYCQNIVTDIVQQKASQQIQRIIGNQITIQRAVNDIIDISQVIFQLPVQQCQNIFIQQFSGMNTNNIFLQEFIQNYVCKVFDYTQKFGSLVNVFNYIMKILTLLTLYLVFDKTSILALQILNKNLEIQKLPQEMQIQVFQLIVIQSIIAKQFYDEYCYSLYQNRIQADYSQKFQYYYTMISMINYSSAANDIMEGIYPMLIQDFQNSKQNMTVQQLLSIIQVLQKQINNIYSKQIIFQILKLLIQKQQSLTAIKTLLNEQIIEQLYGYFDQQSKYNVNINKLFELNGEQEIKQIKELIIYCRNNQNQCQSYLIDNVLQYLVQQLQAYYQDSINIQSSQINYRFLKYALLLLNEILLPQDMIFFEQQHIQQLLDTLITYICTYHVNDKFSDEDNIKYQEIIANLYLVLERIAANQQDNLYYFVTSLASQTIDLLENTNDIFVQAQRILINQIVQILKKCKYNKQTIQFLVYQINQQFNSVIALLLEKSNLQQLTSEQYITLCSADGDSSQISQFIEQLAQANKCQQKFCKTFIEEFQNSASFDLCTEYFNQLIFSCIEYNVVQASLLQSELSKSAAYQEQMAQSQAQQQQNLNCTNTTQEQEQQVQQQLLGMLQNQQINIYEKYINMCMMIKNNQLTFEQLKLILQNNFQEEKVNQMTSAIKQLIIALQEIDKIQ